MGEYADVKRKKILQLLRWLHTLNGFTVDTGGKHQWLVKHEKWVMPFPITFRHNVVSKVYVKELMKRVIETGVCTKEEYDKHL